MFSPGLLCPGFWSCAWILAHNRQSNQTNVDSVGTPPGCHRDTHDARGWSVSIPFVHPTGRQQNVSPSPAMTMGSIMVNRWGKGKVSKSKLVKSISWLNHQQYFTQDQTYQTPLELQHLVTFLGDTGWYLMIPYMIRKNFDTFAILYPWIDNRINKDRHQNSSSICCQTCILHRTKYPPELNLGANGPETDGIWNR